jgi:predicted metal-binding protein
MITFSFERIVHLNKLFYFYQTFFFQSWFYFYSHRPVIEELKFELRETSHFEYIYKLLKRKPRYDEASTWILAACALKFKSNTKKNHHLFLKIEKKIILVLAPYTRLVYPRPCRKCSKCKPITCIGINTKVVFFKKIIPIRNKSRTCKE